MSEPVALLEKRDGVAIVTLNRPEVKNACNNALAVALQDIFDDIEEDKRCFVAVLHGAGGNFSSGGDVFEIIEPLTRMKMPDLLAFTDAATLALALSGDAKKGDVRATAEIAGIMAAKKTSDLIPLCHPLALSKVEVRVEPADGGLSVTARVRTTGQTGVEMEALTAVSVACLTVYDMLKAADKAMTIENVRLLTKTGGKSGDWARP